MLRLREVSELQALSAEIGRDGYDKVYIRAPWVLTPEISQALAGLKRLSADVYLIPDLASQASGLIGVRMLGGHVSLQISNRPIDGWNYWLKRLQDITVAVAALVLFAPLLLLIVLAIRLESRGPILFRQKRLGFNGQVFEVWKFRSMYREHSDLDAAVQTKRNDQRVTRVGRFIRKTSFDELPQLLNVLQGRMSIVGPRPHALNTTAEGRELIEAVDNYASRHRVKPGMTGWAQIHGCRGELDSVEKLKARVEYDLEYIRSWSMLLDARIILSTLRSLLADPNAY
jgi:Undecaprenyl-phosphate glucose phosphotransferase